MSSWTCHYVRVVLWTLYDQKRKSDKSLGYIPLWGRDSSEPRDVPLDQIFWHAAILKTAGTRCDLEKVFRLKSKKSLKIKNLEQLKFFQAWKAWNLISTPVGGVMNLKQIVFTILLQVRASTLRNCKPPGRSTSSPMVFTFCPHQPRRARHSCHSSQTG